MLGVRPRAIFRTRFGTTALVCLLAGLPTASKAAAAGATNDPVQGTPEPEPSLLSGAIAGHDSDLRELSLEELASIPVDSGSFLELDQFRSPMSITIIDRAQIETSGARHLSELLEIFVPGFQYHINKWNGFNWGLRGVTADRNTKVLFQVNGRTMNLEASHGAYTELTLGLLGDIERVEVLRGPAGMVYGSGSLAGVVNIVTRRPDENFAEVSAGVGSMRDQEVEALANVVLAPERRLTLSVGLRRAGGLGDRQAKVFGDHEWPNDGAPSPFGEVTDGSAWSTPGNLRAAMDFQMGALRVYARFTHQQEPTGQYFIVDPWPEYVGTPPADAGTRKVAGELISPQHPLANTESQATNRRLHVVSNLSVGAELRHELGPDLLEFRVDVNAATDQLRVDDRFELGQAYAGADAGAINWSFGERRYSVSLRYLLQRIEQLQLAVGARYRFDDIGPDLKGRNMFNFSEKRPFVKAEEAKYHNFSVFTELMWQPRPVLAFEAGVRLDTHTRFHSPKILANPRVSMIFTPNAAHAAKLVFHTASNNGQAEFYELNWTAFDDDGNQHKEARLEFPLDKGSKIIPPPDEDQLRTITPERAYAFELTSAHQLGCGLRLAPSLSWTVVSDLFAWDADMVRVVNAGRYSFISAELALDYALDHRFAIGANHVYQRVLTADRKGETVMLDKYDVVTDLDGTNRPELRDGHITIKTQGTRDAISQDGDHFLNLSTHITKLHLTWQPLPWLKLGTHARVFWGITGRAKMFAEDIEDNEANGVTENYLGLERPWMPMVKWAVSAHFMVGKRTTLSLFARDLLGDADSRHAVRLQTSSAPVQRGIYTVDQRSFAVRLRHQF